MPRLLTALPRPVVPRPALRNTLQAAGLAAAIATAGLATAAPAPAAYTASASLPGPDGRWDYANWDAATGHVLVAHGSDALEVDPASGAVKVLGAVAGAHQVLPAPGGAIVITSGNDDSVRLVDRATGVEKGRIAVPAKPDAAILSPDGQTAWVMAAKAGVVVGVDLVKARVTARIATKPGLETPVWIAPGLLAINNEDLGELELVDTAAGKWLGRIALPGCDAPSGLALAPDQHLLLSACANGIAALVDANSRQLVRLIPIGKGPDFAAWDQQRQRFLVPCGSSGSLSVIALGRDGSISVTEQPTEPGARTAAFDPATGRLYLPTARFSPTTPPTGHRPASLPGTFHLVVLNPAP